MRTSDIAENQRVYNTTGCCLWTMTVATSSTTNDSILLRFTPLSLVVVDADVVS